ncbi:hypothetical protein KR093_005638, partial [Drosophila rubida]
MSRAPKSTHLSLCRLCVCLCVCMYLAGTAAIDSQQSAVDSWQSLLKYRLNGSRLHGFDIRLSV